MTAVSVSGAVTSYVIAHPEVLIGCLGLRLFFHFIILKFRNFQPIVVVSFQHRAEKVIRKIYQEGRLRLKKLKITRKYYIIEGCLYLTFSSKV